MCTLEGSESSNRNPKKSPGSSSAVASVFAEAAAAPLSERFVDLASLLGGPAAVLVTTTSSLGFSVSVLPEPAAIDDVAWVSAFSAFGAPATPNTLAKKSQCPPDFFAGASSAGLLSAAGSDLDCAVAAAGDSWTLDASCEDGLEETAFDSGAAESGFLVSAALAPLPAKAAKMSSESCGGFSAAESSAASVFPKLSSNSPLSSSSSMGSTLRALLPLK